MAEIQVVYVSSGGICPKCGQGLWGGPPCEHKNEARKAAAQTNALEQNEETR